MRKIVSGATVVALALAGVLTLSATASAEDLSPPVEEVVTTEVVEAPVEEPAPVAEPPAPPVESAPAPEQAPPPSEPVSEPQVAADPVPVVEAQTKGGDHVQEGVCQPQDAHIKPAEGTKSVTITAPEGKVIVAVCVKAGSIKQGNGPEDVTVPEGGVESLTFSHSSGKDISHYTVTYADKPTKPEPVLNECTTGVSTHSTQNNDLWLNVDTRSKGHVEYVENGLRVWTEDNSSQSKVSEGMAVNFPLHDVGVLDLNWIGTSPAPGINLFVDFGDKNGTLVYEEVYGQDLWLTQGGINAGITAPVVGGGNGSTHHGTINQWLELYPEATVTGIAYSLGSGVLGDGVITSIVVGCGTHTFDYVAPPTFEPSCTTVTGSQWIEGDGVLSVAGDWATAQVAVPFAGTLADIGTVLDVEASETQYLGLHIDTAEGTIVFEEEPSYEGNLWSTSAWAGVEAGMGYASFGSIEEYIHLNGDVQVTGIRLLYTHPEASSTTVESFTIGCTVYTFVAPLPEDTTVPGEWSEPVVNCDSEVGDEVTVTREVVITTYTRGEDGSVIKDVETVTENDVYIVTEADIEALDCPLPEEPVDPEEPAVVTPVPTPTVTATPAAVTPKALAVTGNEMGIILPIGAAFVVAFGALLTVLGLRARRQD